MSEITPANADVNVSPFDALRRVDADGEHWSARELMAPLGYDTWQRFESAIDRAKIAACNSGHDCDTAFSQVNQLSSAGNLGEQVRRDYRLTRFASYLLAMNGDPRKPEIAAAQSYFAIKTREAEIGAAPEPLSEIEVARRYLASLEALEEAKQIAAVATADLQAFHASPEWISAGQLGNTLNVGRTTLFKMLRETGVVFKDEQQGGHRIYQAYLDQGWGEARWEMWPNGAGWAWTPYFTRAGVTGVRKILGIG